MKIHEYQAKELCNKHKILVPKGNVAFSSKEAISVAKQLRTLPVVIKAQIHAGGRGKGGGVKIAKSLKDVEVISNEILGMHLVTHQTESKGQKVNKVLIESKIEIVKELYLSILPDRDSATFMIMASTAGGINIEAVAEKSPEKITYVHINPLLNLQSYHCRKILLGLKIPSSFRKSFIKTLFNLYELFIRYDCSLLEINPLVLTKDNQVIVMDAKIDIDSNALYRQKEMLEFRDTDEEDPLEVEASKYNLNYINLGGKHKIATMVNGAGLGMATMDIIKQAGAEPANFLDVGGGATSEMVENGFKIIVRDNNIKGILINIFGGILRCDVLAKGVVEAAKKVTLKMPVIVRLKGTNVEKGHKILADSGLNFITVNNLTEAAHQIAKIASS